MNALLELILEVIWLFLPAGIANTMPVLAAKYNWLPQLQYPLDWYYTWRGKRILGDHKTMRGLIIGILFGSITGYLQHLAFETQPVIQSISLVSYRSVVGALVLGAWIGLGGLFGDALKSFFKRQLNIAPGNPWRPFDQIDLVIGAILFSIWFVPLTIVHIIVSIIITGIISLGVSFVGVQLKIKKTI